MKYSRLHRLFVGENKYLGAGDDQFDLTTGRSDDLSELLADAGQYSETVVLCEGGKEVLDSFVVTRRAHGLLQLGDNAALVGVGQGGRGKDGGELGVFGEEVAEGAQGLRGRVEGGGLDSCRILNSSINTNCSIHTTDRQLLSTNSSHSIGISRSS